MKLEKSPLKPCLFWAYLQFVFNFLVLPRACNLLRYFLKYLVLFRFHVYNFA